MTRLILILGFVQCLTLYSKEREVVDLIKNAAELHLSKLNHLEYSYILERPIIKQKFQVDFKLSDGKFYKQVLALDGKQILVSKEGEKQQVVRKPFPEKIVSSVSFDGESFFYFDGINSVLHVSSKLEDLPNGKFVVDGNPLFAPITQMGMVKEMGDNYSKWLPNQLQKTYPIVPISADTFRFIHPKDGVDVKFSLNKMFLPKKIVSETTAGFKSLWDTKNWTTLDVGGAAIFAPTELSVQMWKNGIPYGADTYKTSLITESLKPTSGAKDLLDFQIPTSLAKEVVNHDLKP